MCRKAEEYYYSSTNFYHDGKAVFKMLAHLSDILQAAGHRQGGGVLGIGKSFIFKKIDGDTYGVGK